MGDQYEPWVTNVSQGELEVAIRRARVRQVWPEMAGDELTKILMSSRIRTSILIILFKNNIHIVNIMSL